MQLQDYYLILGVARDESPDGIRDAFRARVQSYHPGRAQAEGLPAYEELLNAYRVLADPASRRSYDQRQAPGAAENRAASEAEPSPITPPAPRKSNRRIPVEPLSATPVSVLRDFTATRPSWDEVFERFRANFIPGTRKQRQLDALRLDVIIGTEQAAQGGTLALAVPVFITCPQCRGAGRALGYPCNECHGQGVREEERPVDLLIPPMVSDGTMFQVPLGGLGIHNLYLEVRIRVAG